MMDNWKDIVFIVVRWALKFVSGWLAAVGISQGSAEEVVGALLVFGVGAVISLLQRKKDLATPPT